MLPLEPRRLLLATTNLHKIEELRTILAERRRLRQRGQVGMSDLDYRRSRYHNRQTVDEREFGSADDESVREQIA